MLGEKLNKNTWAVIYKLLADVMFLLLALFFLALVADGIIPGIVSRHISFLKITLLVIFNLAALYAIGNYAEISVREQKNNKKTLIFLGGMAILLIFNSLFKLNIYLAVFISIIAVFAFYSLYRNFFPK